MDEILSGMNRELDEFYKAHVGTPAEKEKLRNDIALVEISTRTIIAAIRRSDHQNPRDY